MLLLEREDHLRTLSEHAQRAETGRGSTVLLTGEAGIGKTALLQAFAARAEASHRVLWGACEYLSTARPLGPLLDIAAALDADLSALLDQDAPAARIFACLLDVLQKDRASLLLIFEDVHWADAATLDLIRYLVRRLPVLHVVLILSFRSDEVLPGHPLTRLIGDLPPSALTRIALAPLSVDAVAQLAQQAGRGDVESLYRLTAGNPLYLTEVLASAGAALPDTVREAVWARMARLDGAECAVLQLLSVIPGWTECWLWRALHDVEIDALERCLARGILQRGPADAIAFHHELARQAVLQRLSSTQQQAQHARIVTLLEMRAGGDVPLARLVHHAAAAGDVARVLHLAPRAAIEAARLGAHQQAAQQLELALHHVRQASAEQAAQLYQDWAYESALSMRIDDEVIRARHTAIKIWRRLGRNDKIGHNLRWLSRLHWYRGEARLAEDHADMALRELEVLPVSAELAMAYSVRSQLHMLHDRFGLAIEWGERALALAAEVGDIETRVHALNNIGTAQLFGTGDTAGRAKLEESLRLALAHDYHEHAARVYTNLGEWAVISRRFKLAEHVLTEGITFDRSHDLDSWTFYLQGWQARLRMHQGRLREAEAIARSVIEVPERTLVERLPALSALARTCLRMDDPAAPALLQQALDQALATHETQRIAPIRLALTEAAWLRGDVGAMHIQLEAIGTMPDASPDPWECGEMLVWRQRAGLGRAPTLVACTPAPPWAAELAGNPALSASLFEGSGSPIEAALALMQTQGKETGEALARAVRLLVPTEARALLRRARVLAYELGVVGALPRQRRGHYGVARTHPLGLTAREQQVLRLLAEGHGNATIARCLTRSPRTVEHHLASVYAKLGVSGRIDLLLRLHSEPWILATATPSASMPEK